MSGPAFTVSCGASVTAIISVLVQPKESLVMTVYEPCEGTTIWLEVWNTVGDGLMLYWYGVMPPTFVTLMVAVCVHTICAAETVALTVSNVRFTNAVSVQPVRLAAT